MVPQRVAHRYAKSLIDLAQEQNKLDVIKADMDTLRGMAANRDFLLLLRSPVVSVQKKMAVINALLPGKVDEMTLSFVRLMVNKGREAALPEIAVAYLDQFKEIRHISTVKVTSAVPLSQAALDEIKANLVKSGVTESKIDLHTSIDPELIGGYILEFEGRIYDASVASQLADMRKTFQQPNLHVKAIG